MLVSFTSHSLTIPPSSTHNTIPPPALPKVLTQRLSSLDDLGASGRPSLADLALSGGLLLGQALLQQGAVGSGIGLALLQSRHLGGQALSLPAQSHGGYQALDLGALWINARKSH